MTPSSPLWINVMTGLLVLRKPTSWVKKSKMTPERSLCSTCSAWNVCSLHFEPNNCPWQRLLKKNYDDRSIKMSRNQNWCLAVQLQPLFKSIPFSLEMGINGETESQTEVVHRMFRLIREHAWPSLLWKVIQTLNLFDTWPLRIQTASLTEKLIYDALNWESKRNRMIWVSLEFCLQKPWLIGINTGIE